MSPTHLLPLNEAARLQALRVADLEGALQEPLFQRLVDLAARVFNLPISFLSVVESDHVDFAVTHGISPLAAVPRQETLCSLPVRQADTFIVHDINDAQAAAASVHRQAADKLGLVFYAGTPLLVHNEFAIGALCVSDTSRREFNEEEQQVLETLAALVSQAFVARQRALQHPATAAHWDGLQAIVLQEVHSLEALLRYLTSRPEMHAPTSPATLRVVQRRLADITDLLLSEGPAL